MLPVLDPWPLQATTCCNDMGLFLSSAAELPKKMLGDGTGIATQVAALQGDLMSFAATDGAAMFTEKVKFGLKHANWLQGSMTVAQVMCRELKPGETRLGLVSRCLTLLEKKSLGCETALKQKAVGLQKAK